MRDRLVNALTALAAAGALAMVGINARHSFRSSDRPPPIPRTVMGWNAFATGGIRIGGPRPKVTIVEFSDFVCPFCRNAQAELSSLLGRYPQDVQLVLRHLPTHRGSDRAALAVTCAANQSRFAAMRDLLFEKGDSLGVLLMAQHARAAGVPDSAEFARCLLDPRTISTVAADREAATKLELTGTPVFLVNDQLVLGYRTGEVTRLVQAYLKGH